MSHCDSFLIFVCFQLALLLVWAAEKQPKFEDPLLKGGGGKTGSSTAGTEYAKLNADSSYPLAANRNMPNVPILNSGTIQELSKAAKVSGKSKLPSSLESFMLFHGPASGAGKFGELPESLQRLIIQPTNGPKKGDAPPERPKQQTSASALPDSLQKLMAAKGKTHTAAVESHSAAASTKFPPSLEKIISDQRKGPVPSDAGEMAGKNESSSGMAGQKYGKMSTIPENAEISSYTSEPPNIELELNKKRMEEGKGSGLESEISKRHIFKFIEALFSLTLADGKAFVQAHPDEIMTEFGKSKRDDLCAMAYYGEGSKKWSYNGAEKFFAKQNGLLSGNELTKLMWKQFDKLDRALHHHQLEGTKAAAAAITVLHLANSLIAKREKWSLCPCEACQKAEIQVHQTMLRFGHTSGDQVNAHLTNLKMQLQAKVSLKSTDPGSANWLKRNQQSILSNSQILSELVIVH